jgi:hypothetical protein
LRCCGGCVGGSGCTITAFTHTLTIPYVATTPITTTTLTITITAAPALLLIPLACDNLLIVSISYQR